MHSEQGEVQASQVGLRSTSLFPQYPAGQVSTQSSATESKYLLSTAKELHLEHAAPVKPQWKQGDMQLVHWAIAGSVVRSSQYSAAQSATQEVPSRYF